MSDELKLVPVEPTEEMIESALGEADIDPFWSERGPQYCVKTIYRAMIAAAEGDKDRG